MWHAWGRGIYRVLFGRPEGKRPSGRLRRRWEDNIKLDLRKIGIVGPVAGFCEYGDEPSGSARKAGCFLIS
jgi:hypothetical protein